MRTVPGGLPRSRHPPHPAERPPSVRGHPRRMHGVRALPRILSGAGGPRAVRPAEPGLDAMTDPELLPFTHEEIEGSIPERFARVAATRPAALAIASETHGLTYGELNLRSDRIAAAIARRAPDREMPVAVLLDDHASMITAMLATWKAGRLCLPLDAALPQARLDIILRDAEAGLIVTDREGSAALPTLPGPTVLQLRIDELDPLEPVDTSRTPVTAGQLACLLYTSGSTGQPKGLVRSHRNVLHRARCSVTSLAIR